MIFSWFSHDFMRLLNRFSWIISCRSKLALRILSFTYLRHTVATYHMSVALSLSVSLCLGCYLQMLSRSWVNQKYAKFCLCCQRRLKGKPFDMVGNLLQWVKDVSLTCCKVNNTQHTTTTATATKDDRNKCDEECERNCDEGARQNGIEERSSPRQMRREAENTH